MQDLNNSNQQLIKSCGEFEVCNFNSIYNGFCEPYYDVKKMITLLPGDECPSQFYEYSEHRCAFGPKTCIDGVCQGYKKGDNCTTTPDCNPGLYCASGKCETLKKPGEECSVSVECERGSRCVISSNNIQPGKCVQYGSLENDQQALDSLLTNVVKAVDSADEL